MIIEADTHVLGSRRGYTTVAKSRQVRGDEILQLEELAFGQTGDQHYLRSLQTTSSGYARVLRSGRMAITRCFVGAEDDRDRITLELRTLVLDADDYIALCDSSLKNVFDSDAVWSRERFLSGESVAIDSTQASDGSSMHIDTDDLVVLDCWLQAMRNRSSLPVVPDTKSMRDAILRFPGYLPRADRLKFCWGIRLLGAVPGIHVATLAQGANRSGRRRIIDVTPTTPALSREIDIFRPLVENKELRAFPPLETIVRSVEAESSGTEQEYGPLTPASPRKTRLAAAAIALLLIGTGAVSWSLMRLPASARVQEEKTTSGEQPVAERIAGRSDSDSDNRRMAEIRSQIHLVLEALPQDDARLDVLLDHILANLQKTLPGHLSELELRVSRLRSSSSEFTDAQHKKLEDQLFSAKAALLSYAYIIVREYTMLLLQDYTNSLLMGFSGQQLAIHTKRESAEALHRYQEIAPWLRAWSRNDADLASRVRAVESLVQLRETSDSPSAVESAAGQSTGSEQQILRPVIDPSLIRDDPIVNAEHDDLNAETASVRDSSEVYEELTLERAVARISEWLSDKTRKHDCTEIVDYAHILDYLYGYLANRDAQDSFVREESEVPPQSLPAMRDDNTTASGMSTAPDEHARIFSDGCDRLFQAVATEVAAIRDRLNNVDAPRPNSFTKEDQCLTDLIVVINDLKTYSKSQHWCFREKSHINHLKQLQLTQFGRSGLESLIHLARNLSVRIEKHLKE